MTRNSSVFSFLLLFYVSSLLLDFFENEDFWRVRVEMPRYGVAWPSRVASYLRRPSHMCMATFSSGFGYWPFFAFDTGERKNLTRFYLWLYSKRKFSIYCQICLMLLYITLRVLVLLHTCSSDTALVLSMWPGLLKHPL